MKVLKIAGCYSLVMLLATGFLYSLNASLENPTGPRPRVLFISDSTNEYWQRSVAGARDAARQFGIELRVEAPTFVNVVDAQAALMQNFNPAEYNAVAISPVNPSTQLDLINDLSHRTKLVTLGNDSDHSCPLCRVGYSSCTEGRMVARLVCNELAGQGNVVLLNAATTDVAANDNVNQRLKGFEEAWSELSAQNASMLGVITSAELRAKESADVSKSVAAILADPKLAFVVALDTQSAEAAAAALASIPVANRVPVIAFEPSVAVFDAIADGRVLAAVFRDPYREAYAAIARLDIYYHADDDALPVPGRGNFLLMGEIVRKENVAELRRRISS